MSLQKADWRPFLHFPVKCDGTLWSRWAQWKLSFECGSSFISQWHQSIKLREIEDLFPFRGQILYRSFDFGYGAVFQWFNNLCSHIRIFVVLSSHRLNRAVVVHQTRSWHKDFLSFCRVCSEQWRENLLEYLFNVLLHLHALELYFSGQFCIKTYIYSLEHFKRGSKLQ